MRVAGRHAARYHPRMLAFVAGSGPYAGSTEELTPVRLDWLSAVPLAMIAILLLAAPKIGRHAGARRLWRAFARSPKHPADRERGFA